MRSLFFGIKMHSKVSGENYLERRVLFSMLHLKAEEDT
jgi:hypothetical protein